MADEQKPIVEARSSDKIMYYYKGPWEALPNPCHVLGTQGATSGTNTATLGSTATKQFNVKDTGSKNQQRVVNVVMTKGDGFKTDVARDLWMVWQEGLTMPLWRVDWNTLRVVNGKQVVDAEYSQVKISALPETEALNTAVTQNVTFEVTGEARRYDSKGQPFTLSAEDFDDGIFTATLKYYNFARPSQIGADADGKLVTTAGDDSNAGDPNGTVAMNQKFTAGSSSDVSKPTA